MKTIDEMLIGCEHDGSFIPAKEVKRLMLKYADSFKLKNRSDKIGLLADFCEWATKNGYMNLYTNTLLTEVLTGRTICKDKESFVIDEFLKL